MPGRGGHRRGAGLKRLGPVLSPDRMSSKDETRCPVCGEPYDQRIVVERGDRWSDLFPGTTLDFFQRYYRRCSAQQDVEADTTRPGRECVVYFHEADRGPVTS